jgi:hypothetical protein
MLFLKKIFTPVSLVLSLFLLIYIFYRAEIYWQGLYADYYKKYYNISFCLIAISIISFFINKNIKEYLIITLISLIVGLYILEGFLTFYKHTKIEKFTKYKVTKDQNLNNQKYKIYKKETGKEYDRRNLLEAFKDLKKINNKATLFIAPSHDLSNKKDLLNLGGISDSETIHCNENGYYSIYKSDRYGFNNPNSEWDKEIIEYLLVGDSFTHGACVNRNDDITSVLRALSSKSAINLGSSGNGPLLEYAALREYLKPNVKKVIWLYYEGNDQFDLLNENSNYLLKNYLSDLTFTQNLQFRQKEIDDLLNLYIEIELNKSQNQKNTPSLTNHVLQYIKIYNLRNFFFSTKTRTPPSLQEFKKIIELTKDLVNKNNSKLYFVYLPEYNRYKNNYNDFSYIEVKKIINELNITLIDIHENVIKKEEDPLKIFPFAAFGHYNVMGYKKIAENIYNITKD